MLDKLAELSVRTGLNVQPNQQVIMSAPMAALPFVRALTKHAYQAGASLVTTLYADEECTLARYQHGSNESFDAAADWLYRGMAEAFASGAARLAVSGDNPALLAGQDADKIARAARSNGIAYKVASSKIQNFDMNWHIIPFVTPAWAKQVFPGVPEHIAVRKLWKAVFHAVRVDNDDPVALWKEHNAKLHARNQYLNGKRYSALKYVGPGTDLTLGLADDHNWVGGSQPARNGVICNPNMPTEENFTAPHCMRTFGHVSSTKPLSLRGTLVEGIRVTFHEGAIIDAKAEKGQAVLEKLIGTDAGSKRLGEVALVPHSSPISQSGLLYFNTLFDENAASHIAIGSPYTKCVKGGGEMKAEDLTSRGLNTSDVHVDWMIGSDKIDIDGITADGTAEPLMRKGEFVF
jgi:aminopeptidase